MSKMAAIRHIGFGQGLFLYLCIHSITVYAIPCKSCILSSIIRLKSMLSDDFMNCGIFCIMGGGVTYRSTEKISINI